MSLRIAFRAAASTLFMAAVIGGTASAQAVSSPEVGRPLQEAVSLIGSGDIRGGLAKADEAAAVAEKTQEDVQLIEQVRTAAYSQLGDYASAARSLQAWIDAGAPDAQAKRKTLAQVLYQAGQRERAVESAQAYIDQYGADTDLLMLMASVANDTGDNAAVMRHVRAAIDAKAGAPDEQWLLLYFSAAYKLGDLDQTTQALEMLIRAYPKESYWRDYIQLSQRAPGFDDAYDLDVYRLLIAAGVALTPEERQSMAEVALINGLPGEAVTVLEDGFATGALADERMQRLLDQARERAAADRPTLGELEAEAQADPGGQPLVALGEAYLAYGDASKAADLIESGLAKGGVANESAARLHLGVAQMQAGDVDAASATFEAVSGVDGSARLARAWRQIARRG